MIISALRQLLEIGGGLWFHLSLNKKTGFVGVLVYGFITSIAEIVSVGAIIPFLYVITGKVENSKALDYLELYFPTLSITHGRELMTFVFIGLVIIASIFRALYLRLSIRVAFLSGAELSAKMYKASITQDYESQIRISSSERISLIASKSGIVISQILMPMVLIINSAVFLGVLMLALILIDPISTFVVSFTLFLFYYIIARITKAKVAKSSLNVSIGLDSLFKYLRESYGGIRDIIIDGREEHQIKRYIEIESDLRDAQASIALISQAPKVIIEAFVMIAMILYSYHAIGQDGGVGVIATIAASAYVIQKILPLIQQAYNGLVSFRGHLDVAYDVLAALNSKLSTDKSLQHHTRLPISQSIEFRNVAFKYSTSDKLVLKNISVKFEKGLVYGVCGESGEGKSTLVDILMGLLYPTSGEVLVDGLVLARRDLRVWRKNISHVPQSAFLMDDTIINNICLADSVNIQDIDRVNSSIDLAQLRDFVGMLPDGLKTEIGEQGCNMSGGQRQRLSIARAIYKNSEVIVLDEPTSALDFETANQVISSIISLKTGRVIVVVSHDYNILRRCDHLLKIKGGVVQID